MKRGVAILLVFLGSLVGAFLWGRSSKPAEIREVVKTETKVEYVDRWREVVVYRDRVKVQNKVRIVTVAAPDGTTTTTTTDDSSSESVSTSTATASGESTGTADTKTETVKVTSAGRAGWRLEVGGQWDTDRLALAKPETWRFSGSRRLAGPFWLGASYSTDKAVGMHLGVTW